MAAMAERRYTEDEVAAIIRAAAEQQQASLGAPAATGDVGSSTTPVEGMTLAQIHEIGREVGIPAELVTRAAGALERKGRATERRLFGLPIGVGRTVPLQRRLSDEEWNQLVVDLRQTFDARGRLKEEGSFRQWTNGNLQALLEPTPTGHQLRLKTMKGDSSALITGGLAMLTVSAGIAIAAAFGGASLDSAATLAVAGLAAFGFGAIRLPGWARRRRQQMEEIAARLTEPGTQ
jgi:hypothetical protein